VLEGEEARLEKFITRRNRELSSGSSSEEEGELESEEDEDSCEDGGSTERQQRPRKQKPADLMKDARELFRWSGDQKMLAITLWRSLDEDNKDAQMDALLASLCSFIFTKYSSNPLTSRLVHFTAVLGIDTEMDRLRTAKNYSYMLAGMVYCVRVLAVEKLLPAEQRDEQTDDNRKHFLEMRKKYIADRSFSPMSEMISLLAYSKYIALNAGNVGNAY
jgi:hypothetical protein